ncbi:hypothetical protein PENSPDRAFT_686510 [Peniophora sp. CONT]|nr:hypothetical protein PENSPDRAFT_686510 [Peniophora sp. CONT]
MPSDIMSTYPVYLPDWPGDDPASEKQDQANYMIYGNITRSAVVDRLQYGEAPQVLLELTTAYMGLRRLPHRFCTRAVLLVDALAYATDPSANRLSKEIWKDLVRLGFAEIYCDLILDPTFCCPQGEGDMKLVTALFRGLHHILSFMRTTVLISVNYDMDDVVHRIFPRVWQRVWEDRPLLLHRDDSVDHGQGRDVIEACLQQSADFYQMRFPGGCLPPSSYVPYVALSLWLDSDAPPSRALLEPYIGCMYGPSKGIPKDDVIKLVEDIVLDAYGPHVVFDKIDGVIESNSGERVKTCYADVLYTLNFLSGILSHTTIFLHFSARDTFHYMLDMFQDHTRSLREKDTILGEGYNPWMMWERISSIISAFWFMNEQARKGQSPGSFSLEKFSGHEIVKTVVCALELIALGYSPEEKGDQTDQLRERDLSTLIEVLPLYHKFKKDEPQAWVFNEGIKRGMRACWYDGVHFLRTAQYRLGNHAHVYEEVEKAWMKAGQCYGLDELAEKRRHQREARKYCSDLGCPYSRADPPDALLACRGCGDAWYCDSGCQKRDWKKGGHKKVCGRRLKAA